MNLDNTLRWIGRIIGVLLLMAIASIVGLIIAWIVKLLVVAVFS